MSRRESQINLDGLMSEIQAIFEGAETPSLYDVNKVLSLGTQVGQSLFILKKEYQSEKAQKDFEFDVYKANGHQEAQKLLERDGKRPTVDAIANQFLISNEEELRVYNTELTELKLTVQTLESYERYIRDCLSACKSIGDNLRFLGVE